MKLTIRNQADFVAAIILGGIGITALVVTRDYPVGTAARIGPGFMPVAAALLLSGLALVLLLGSLVSKTRTEVRLAPLPIIVIVGSCLLFAYLLRPLGVLPASVLVVLVSTLASRTLGWMVAFGLAIVVAVFVTAVFVGGLGLQAPALGYWFD